MAGLTLREQFEGFPLYQIAVVCVLRFAESLAHTQVLPYQTHMLRKFHIAPTESDIFKFQGYLMAAYNISQTLSNIFWSKKSDQWGRKTVLIIGLLGNAISLLIYGFSGNFSIAMISKVIGGLTSANMAVTRTVLGEIAPQKKHHFLSFATFPLFWNLGSIIGPVIGAKLKTPHTWPGKDSGNSGSSGDEKWSHEGSESGSGDWDHNSLLKRTLPILKTYPFALPNIVAAVILVVAAIILFLFLEETQKDKRESKDRGLDLGDKIRAKLGFHVSDRSWKLYKYSIVEEAETLVLNTEDDMEEDIEMTSFNKPDDEEEHTSPFTFNVINTIISHFIMLLHIMVYGEFLPVFFGAATLVKDLSFPFKVKGGFGFDEAKIGGILSLNGFFGVLMVLFVLPALIRKYDSLSTYRIALAVFPVCYFFLPEIIFTLPEYNSSMPKHFHLLLIYLDIILKEFASVIAFSQILILIHRAAEPKHRAMVNGYAISVSSFASIFAPLVWGAMMTAFDKIALSTMFWWLLSFITGVGFVHSYLLRDN